MSASFDSNRLTTESIFVLVGEALLLLISSWLFSVLKYDSENRLSSPLELELKSKPKPHPLD